MKDFEPLSEEEIQAIIARNKHKARQAQTRRIRNIAISASVATTLLTGLGLWARERVILSRKCSALSYGHPTDVTREQCGNLYFKTYEYWTPVGGKQRTDEPPGKWCIYDLRGLEYAAPCPTP